MEIKKFQNSLDKAKICLLRLPMIVTRWDNFHSTTPPLGLAYVAGSLLQEGYDVRALDALGEAPLDKVNLPDDKYVSYGLTSKQIVQHLAYEDFNVLFVSIMFSLEWPMAKSIIRTIKKVYPNILLVCGGEHVSSCPEFCLEDCSDVDICVVGEGEETSTNLLKALEQKKSLDKVNGIAYRSEGTIKRTTAKSRIAQLDNIPRPAWELFPIENYLSNGLGYGIKPGRSMPMLISRGCPYQCTFCSSPQMWTTKWQARNVDCVIEEMQFYIDKFGATNFDLYDLTAIVRKDWIKDFCQKIIKKNWNIAWQMPAGTRSEALDDETLELLHLSGQQHIVYAPESGSEEVLRRIKKKIKLDRMKTSIKSAIRKKMYVKCSLMIGFPDETHKNVWQTLNFIKDLAIIGTNDIYVASFSPYPGSELFNELRKNGKIPKVNDEYFYGLISYSNFFKSISYSQHVGNRMLAFYRIIGMLMFYIISYTIRPKRFLRLVANVFKGREESRMDKALIDIFDRLKRGKKGETRDIS